MNAAVIDVTTPSFEEDVTRSPVPVLVDFTAAWCAPCRTISPHVDAIAQSHAGRVRVGKCDADSNHELTARFDVRSLPTLLMFKNGEVVGQIVGAVPRAKIVALVEKALGC